MHGEYRIQVLTKSEPKVKPCAPKFLISCHVITTFSLNRTTIAQTRRNNHPSIYTMAPKSKPQLTTIDADAPLESILDLVKRDGGCIVRNIVPVHQLERVGKEVKHTLDRQHVNDGKFFAQNSRRSNSLVQASKTFATEVIANEKILALANAMMTSRYHYWTGERRVAVSPPQVSATGALVLGPGSKAQDFHRDDQCWHVSRPTGPAEVWTENRDVQLSFLICASRATEANGATRVIPGSHLWDDDREPMWEDGVAFAEMEPGSALCFLGSVYHAGGENTTADQWRHLYAVAFLRGYLRQEENQYLAVQKEVAKRLPLQIQELIGYNVSAPFCGWVEYDSPVKVLTGGETQVSDWY